MKEAISFGRFSSGKQEKGDSLARQRNAYERVCARYADRCQPSTRYGFGHFFGHGESGFHGRHLKKGGSLRLLLDKMKSGEIDPTKSCLVVEAFDRLGRLVPDLAMKLISEIVRSGCPVVIDSPDMWIDTEDLGGSKFIVIAAMLQLAHAESKQKSERLKASWSSRRANARKKPLTSNCPRWIRLVDGRLELHPQHAKTVREIFDLCIAGVGSNTIAKRLEREGVRRMGRSHWRTNYVHDILRSKATIGFFQPMVDRKPVGQPILDYFPPVVSQEIFYKAQAAMNSREGIKGRTGPAITNLFTGLLYDARGGKRMILRRNSVQNILMNDTPRHEDVIGIPYDLMENVLLVMLHDLTLQPATSTTKQKMEVETDLIAELSRKIAKIQQSDIEFDSLVALLRKLETEKKEAQARLDLLKGEEGSRPSDELEAAQHIIEQVREAGEKSVELRDQLRNKVRRLIAKIWITLEADSRYHRRALVKVVFHSGEIRSFRIETVSRGKHKRTHVYYAFGPRHPDLLPSTCQTFCGMIFHAQWDDGES